jgi:hypothetical protein
MTDTALPKRRTGHKAERTTGGRQLAKAPSAANRREET